MFTLSTPEMFEDNNIHLFMGPPLKYTLSFHSTKITYIYIKLTVLAGNLYLSVY